MTASGDSATSHSLSRMLDDYIFKSRASSSEAFDTAHMDLIAEVEASIGTVFSFQIVLLATEATLLGARFEAFALTRAALDTIVSALHLARQRAYVDVACLLRSSLEAACTAVHITKDATAYDAFISGTYASTKAISAAKLDIPVVGALWGALSKAAIHVNRRAHGSKWQHDSENGGWTTTIDLTFSKRETAPLQDLMTIKLISLIGTVLARAQELSQLEADPDHPGWARVPGTTKIFTSGSVPAIDRRYNEFLALSKQ
jgi:hypothetical protein